MEMIVKQLAEKADQRSVENSHYECSNSDTVKSFKENKRH